MSERTHHFDLKLLTASKDVGLRRLRSYAASLGGGAQIFYSYEDLRLSLETCGQPAQHSIVVHDTSLVLTANELLTLATLSRLFQLHQPQHGDDLNVPAKGAPSWDLESYMRCSLTNFFDSAVVRMSMAQLCKTDGPFHLEQLLRWGYAAQTWDAANHSDSVADASLAFIRSLNLAGDGRRLTEVATHFLQTRLRQLGLVPTGVTFGADGLTTIVIARCTKADKIDIAAIAKELRLHDFPVAIINQLPNDNIEIGALCHPGSGGERTVMMFQKTINVKTALSSPQDAQDAQDAQGIQDHQESGVLRLKLGKVS